MTERRQAPASQYLQTVASGLTVALLVWIGNTIATLPAEVAKLTVTVSRHERDITEMQAEIRRESDRKY